MTAFEQSLEKLKTEQAQIIAEIMEEVASHHDAVAPFFYGKLDELKGHLGAQAANECDDNESAQDEAISQAEALVADLVSGNATNEIAAILWLDGVDDGARLIRRAIAHARGPQP